MYVIGYVDIKTVMEPLFKGHFEDNMVSIAPVLCRKVVLFWRFTVHSENSVICHPYSSTLSLI